LSRSRRAADRIRQEIPIIRLLEDYGYEVDSRGGDREQQFSCDLHGDGRDSKPSARVYPGSGQFFCFACGRSRDHIALVREKEGLSFWDAVRSLEKRFGLPPLPWEPGDSQPRTTPKGEIEAALDPSETPERALHRLERFLYGITQDRMLTAQKCAGLWEAYDRVVGMRETGEDPKRVILMTAKILGSARKALGLES